MGTTTLVDAAANAVLDALTARVDGGTCEIWTVGETLLLATMTLGSPAFAGAASRAANINAVGEDVSADNDGTAALAIFKNSSAQEQFRGTVTVSAGGGLVEFASITWNTGDTIDITGGSLTYPA